jgi:hypothetical protein
MTSKPTTSTGAATPGDYLLYADSYWLAAKRLFNGQPLPGIPLPGLESHLLLPGLTLVCISIELSFKAFLAKKNFDERQMKDVGHNLKRALTEVRQRGFFDECEQVANAQIDTDIEYLDGIYCSTSLKYPLAPRTFRGDPTYLELAQFLIRVAASCCSVDQLRSLSESAFDGPQFGRITNSDTSP